MHIQQHLLLRLQLQESLPYSFLHQQFLVKLLLHFAGIKAGDTVVVAHLTSAGVWENIPVTNVADGVVYAKFTSLSPYLTRKNSNTNIPNITITTIIFQYFFISFFIISPKKEKLYATMTYSLTFMTYQIRSYFV